MNIKCAVSQQNEQYHSYMRNMTITKVN